MDSSAATSRCDACDEVRAASDKYGKWVFVETYNDGALIAHTMEALGLCTVHASRFVDADALEQAGTLYEPVVRGIARQIRASLDARTLRKNVLAPTRPCPWCEREHGALRYVFDHLQSVKVCIPHQRQLNIYRAQRGDFPFGGPQPPAPTLVCEDDGGVLNVAAFSAAAEDVLTHLRHTCVACKYGQEAETARITYLRREGLSESDMRMAEGLCLRHWDATDRRLPGAAGPVDEAGAPIRCSVCDIAWRYADRFAAFCAIALGEPRFAFNYGHTRGLCLTHVRFAINRAADTSVKRHLLSATAARLETLAWEIEQRSAQRAFDLRDQPRLPYVDDAPRRALWMLAGGLARRYEGMRFGI